MDRKTPRADNYHKTKKTISVKKVDPAIIQDKILDRRKVVKNCKSTKEAFKKKGSKGSKIREDKSTTSKKVTLIPKYKFVNSKYQCDASVKGSSILTDKWYKKFAKLASKPAQVYDIRNTIINQPNLTLQFNSTILNQPATYRVSNKYK